MDENAVIVVGSGPTGVITALTLVRAKIPVVMLESGNKTIRQVYLRLHHRELKRSPNPSVRKHVPYAEFVNLNDCRTRWVKAHCLGGRSNFWGGIVMRFSEQDFQDGERLHPKFRWPLSYQDLEPYYQKVEKIIGVRGSQASFETLPACDVVYNRELDPEWQNFAQICQKMGRALTVLPDVYGSHTLISTTATPQNIAMRLMGQLRRSKNFQLIKNAHVTRIEVNQYEPKVRAIEYLNPIDGSLHQKVAKAVVLAAGPLASTQILLNSDCISFPQGLGNSQGLLGKYLHDHPYGQTTIESDFLFQRLDGKSKGGLYITRKSYNRSPPLQATAFLIYGGVDNRQSVTLHPGLMLNNHATSDQVSGSDDKSCMTAYYFGTQIPSPENYVSLHSTHQDSYGLPLLQINLRFNEAELANMRQGSELVSEILTAAKHRIFSLSSQLQPPGTSVHYGGAVRMHHSPQYGVLDEWNRIHDIKNLLVVDASCFTTCVEKNPTLTAMALAMRAAEKLAQERLS
jgi:choline dehydrogenase-like flavoprotein